MYSLLDGGNRLDKLVARVKELGMEAVAVTDHGNLFGAVEFYTKAKAEGIKPILGIEAYVAPDLSGKPSDRLSREYTGVSDGGFHLVLLAENNLGWSNLLKLSSDSYIRGFYYKPRMDKTTLTQWHDGLIAINGHLGSSIAHYLVQYTQTKNEAHFEAARQEAIWHRDLFGTNEKGEPRFYLELQSHAEKLQDQINPHIVQLARELDIPLVCDNDAHFLTADDWDAHDTLCCISMGKLKTEDNRLRYPRDLYVKSPEEMSKRFVQELDLPEAIDNTRRIAERCNVELDFGANHAPVVKIETDLPKLPADSGEAIKVIERFSKHCEHPVGSTAWYKAFCATIRVQPFNSETDSDSPDDLKQQCDGALRLLTEAGAIWRYGTPGSQGGGVDDAKRARMERELTVLRDKLISAYFMIVWDFVNEARRRDIPVNARGSGVGTMTGYCLGLSNACPVEYGLLFERFTDPDRSEYPDIDIDMCQDGRGDLIAYVREKYGHVAQIITFGTLKARAAIRDVGRVLDMPLPEVDKVCKLIGDGLGTTLEKAQQQEPDLRKLLEDSPQHRTMYDTARRLEGLARHAGVHAAGVIVATQPLDNIVPLYQPPGTEQIVTQWDGPTCEKVGLLKMDFLGLRTLSIIERAKLLIRQTLDEQTIRETISRDVQPTEQSKITTDPLDLDRLTYDDPRVFELFARGETAGVFQFESGGMRNLLMAMKPDRLEDLIAANALYRPGPMELIPNYNNRKHGREQVPQMHAIVDRLTAETHGIMVYQEQVMQVLNELGGIPLREAYSIIKAISKKKEKTINAARADFVKGADTHGVSGRQANELFDLILKFAGYGFNKSHSTGYAIIAYQTAYLKTYFPVQYMAALLTYESVSTDKVVEYMDECAHVLRPAAPGREPQRGIEVKPPDINQSDVGFTVVYRDDEPRDAAHGHIRFGLSAVKGVGEKAILTIRAERDKNGPYKGLYDFCERVDLRAVNRSTTEALIKCGAFDTVHGIEARAALCEALETAIKVGQRAAADKASGQMSIFGGAAPTNARPERSEGRDPTNQEPTLPATSPWSKKQLLDHEKEVLGLYASSHPLHDHKAELDRYSTITIPQIKENGLPAGVKVIVGGMLSRVRPTIVKRGRSQGQKMAHLTLEDSASNKIDATVFSDVFASHYLHLEQDRVVFLEGKIDRGREEPGLLVDRVIPIEQAVERLTRTLRIIVHDHGEPGRHNGASKEQFGRLRELLRQSAMRNNGNGSSGGGGNAEVVLELHQAGKVVALKLNGSRVPVDPDLVASIQTVMSNLDDRTARCQLLGPPKLSTDDIAQATQYQPPRRELAFSMQDDGGESIDRY